MGEAREVLDRLTRAATEERNIEAAVHCYADEAVMVTPDAGEVRGRDGIGDYWRPFLEAIPDVSFESLRKYETGDTAIDEGWLTGTHTRPMRLPDGETIPPTGRQIKLRECDVATVRDGTIREHHVYFDQAEFLEQLGMAPSQPPA
jgi:ketosteroid isomerase-like protein